MTTILDSHGLCRILSISQSTLKQTWRGYPCFFVGTGRSLRSARFLLDDVLGYLKERDYGILRQNDKNLDGPGAARRRTTTFHAASAIPTKRLKPEFPAVSIDQ